MTLDQIKDRLQKIIDAQGDDEVAHSLEDSLRSDFIEYVANAGPPELAAMASEVLKSESLKFSRWCA